MLFDGLNLGVITQKGVEIRSCPRKEEYVLRVNHKSSNPIRSVHQILHSFGPRGNIHLAVVRIIPAHCKDIPTPKNHCQSDYPQMHCSFAFSLRFHTCDLRPTYLLFSYTTP